jgi:hypothetical protein
MISKARDLIRTSLLVGLAAGSLVIDSHPACANPVGTERALLEQVDVPSASPQESVASAADDERPWIDGEAALLNRRPNGGSNPARPDAAGETHPGAAFLDGAKALVDHAVP